MKKILLTIAIVVILLCSGYWINYVIDKETNRSILVNNHQENISYVDNKFNIYFFWGQGCPHCEELSSYLKSIPKKYRDKYQLVTFEVWDDTTNKTFMKNIADTLSVKPEGVPFVIIGDKYFTGYTSKNKEDILDMIKEECDKETHYDVYKTYKEEQN